MKDSGFKMVVSKKFAEQMGIAPDDAFVTITDDSVRFVVCSFTYDENSVREKYIRWAKENSEVSDSFKRKLDFMDIEVIKTWKHCRQVICSGEVKLKLPDGKTITIDVNREDGGKYCVEGGFVLSKRQTKNLKKTTELMSIDGPCPLVFEDSEKDWRNLENYAKSLDLYRDILCGIKREFKLPNVEAQVQLELAESIADINVVSQTIYFYPEYTIRVREGRRSYGGNYDRDVMCVPDFAPANKSFKRWKAGSVLIRHANFLIFLLSAAMAIGLMIAAEGVASTAEGGGLPSILCAFWIFPINIAGVVLPYFLFDNDALDLFDFKYKVEFYAKYNLIYLIAATLFVGGAHLAAYAIW